MKVNSGMHIFKLVIVFYLALLVIFIAGCSRKSSRAIRERIIRVEVAQLQERVFRHRIPVHGTVQPVEFATISARTGGILEELIVSEGDTVKSGQLLFQIDRKNLKNALVVNRKELEVMRSELKTARIALDLKKIVAKKAELDYNRAVTLMKTAAISQESFESADVAFKQAKAEIAKAEAAVAYSVSKFEQQETKVSIAEKDLADSSCCAPYDAVVSEKLAEPGEFVAPGTAILKLENQSLLEVVCNISASNYMFIIPGKTLGIFKLDGKRAGEALVSYRAPSIDPLSRTFKVKLLLPKNSPLVSGMLCDVELVAAESHGYGVKSDAVMLLSSGENIVFVERDGKAMQIKVTPGITDGNYTELVECGALVGSDIVIKGQTFLNSGDLLNVANAKKNSLKIANERGGK